MTKGKAQWLSVQAIQSRNMLAVENYSDLVIEAAPPKNLLEIHRCTISTHRAKTGYDYPTIRLPHIFSRLIGLSTRIYQTVHDGALAFLVVISPTEKASASSKSSALTWRRSPVRIRPSPLVFDFSETFAFI
jgi:hypothetical protein